MDWNDAACKGKAGFGGYDDLFFPTGDSSVAAEGQIKRAKSLCNDCSIKEECLEYAVENNVKHGIWGGLTERQREKYRNGLMRSRRRNAA